MLKVLVADDHALIRQGIKSVLSETPDITVAGEAASAHETLEKARLQNWDVLVLDILMPDRSGFDIIGELRHEHPSMPILVLSIYSEVQLVARLLNAGVSGYLTKESVPEELVRAIRKVAAGGKYISPLLAESLALYLSTYSMRPLHDNLSDREFQVMRMIGAGESLGVIAEKLSLSIKTVSTYSTRIRRKLNLDSRAAIVRYVMQNNL